MAYYNTNDVSMVDFPAIDYDYEGFTAYTYTKQCESVASEEELSVYSPSVSEAWSEITVISEHLTPEKIQILEQEHDYLDEAALDALDSEEEEYEDDLAEEMLEEWLSIQVTYIEEDTLEYAVEEAFGPLEDSDEDENEDEFAEEMEE